LFAPPQTKSESFFIAVDVDRVVSKPKLFDRPECKNCIFKGGSYWWNQCPTTFGENDNRVDGRRGI